MITNPCPFAVVHPEATCRDRHIGDETIRRTNMGTIQSGAVRRRKDFAPIEHSVRFSVHRQLTDYCTELISITQSDVDNSGSNRKLLPVVG